MAGAALGRKSAYTVLPKWLLSTAALVSPQVREIRELLPRYEHDNIFDSTRFTSRFPDFEVTGHREGLALIARPSRLP